MDNLAFYIYLIGIADNIKDVLRGCLVAWAIIGFFLFSTFPILTEKPYAMFSKESLKKFAIILVIAGGLLGFLQAIIPNNKTLAAMFIIPAIVKNEDIQHIANDNLKAIRLLSEKWLVETIQDSTSKDK